MKNGIDGVLKTIRKKRYFSRVLILCITLFVSALIFNFYQKSSNLVTGGPSGIAIILEYLFEWESSSVIFIISSVLLVVSFFALGFEQTSGAIISTLVYPVFVDLTADWPSYFPVDNQDMLLISIFIGVVGGITGGLVYKNGFNSGGFSVISQILYKYYRISVSTSGFIINTIVVLVGGIFFGIEMVMYAIIILYISSIVNNRVLIGVSKNKNVYIMTDKEEEIKDYLLNTLHHGFTEFDVKGGYKFKKKKVLMSAIPTKDYFKLKSGIKLIDENVFFIVTDSYQVYGGK